MIARQRQNLSRTFAARELGNASENTIARLKKAQEELLDATSEFADGAQEFGTIVSIHDAAQQMEQAVQALASGDLIAGTTAEENALAELIRARKNLRKILAAKGGSSASQCRSFDYQQKQKLRTPEEMLKESGEQLAQKCEQLDELAQEQRKWSEEVRQRAKGGPELDRKPPQQSQSQSSGGKQSSSSQQQQAAQQKSLNQLQQLAKNLNQSTDTSDATQQRLDEAIAEIEDSIETLHKDEPEQAADQAEQAAEKLDEVADHLAALNQADFAQQLGAASRMAQRLADQQSEIASKMQGGKSGSPSGSSGNRAGEQRRLAESAELLSDLFSRLQGASLDEDRETRAALKELAGSNPPGEIAGLMKDAADDLDAAKEDAAARSAGLAADDLKELASGLREIRNAYSQPRLDELIAAEEQAAELLSGVKRSDSENDLALLQSKLAALQSRLDQLSQRDSRLSQAVAGMQNGTGKPSSKPSTQQGKGQAGKGSGSSGDGEYTGFQKSQRVMADGVREIGQVLQKRIQEVILSGALSDGNAAVPPEYQKLVEEYYRTLSDDLR